MFNGWTCKTKNAAKEKSYHSINPVQENPLESYSIPYNLILKTEIKIRSPVNTQIKSKQPLLIT